MRTLPETLQNVPQSSHSRETRLQQGTANASQVFQVPKNIQAQMAHAPTRKSLRNEILI